MKATNSYHITTIPANRNPEINSFLYFILSTPFWVLLIIKKENIEFIH